MSTDNARSPSLYLAAPLFSNAERAFNAHLKTILLPYCRVHLPQEDGPMMPALLKAGMSVDEARLRVFKSDIEAIRSCESLLIVLDGRAVDEGAAFELGFAYALGKHCVGLKTDFRSLAGFGDNPMISCSLNRIFSSESELMAWAAGRSHLVRQ